MISEDSRQLYQVNVRDVQNLIVNGNPTMVRKFRVVAASPEAALRAVRRRCAPAELAVVSVAELGGDDEMVLVSPYRGRKEAVPHEANREKKFRPTAES